MTEPDPTPADDTDDAPSHAQATPNAGDGSTTGDARVEALRTLIERSLDDDQAVDVQTIPLAGKSTIADYMVIASGRSTRQVASMAQKIAQKVKQELKRDVRLEGLTAADWVLIDAKDVIVHLFRPEVRSFYALEKMWAFDSAGAPTRADGAAD